MKPRLFAVFDPGRRRHLLNLLPIGCLVTALNLTAAEAPLGRLAAEPRDRAALTELRRSLLSMEPGTERNRQSTIYMLGAYLTGRKDEALKLREGLLRAYADDQSVRLLADANLSNNCAIFIAWYFLE